MRFTLGVILTFSLPMSTGRTPEVSFELLQGCLRCVVGSLIMVSNLRDMLVVVGTMCAVCMELSPTASRIASIGALGFVRVAQFGSPLQFCRGHGSWTLGLRTRRRRRKPHMLTWVMGVFFFLPSVRVCVRCSL